MNDINTSRTFDIMNLTPLEFTVEELKILHLGLNFCPTRNVDQFEFIKDINLFI